MMSSEAKFDVCELLLREALLDVAFSAHIEEKSRAGSVHNNCNNQIDLRLRHKGHGCCGCGRFVLGLCDPK